jgi:acyl carrier protein
MEAASPARQAVFEALKASVPHAFDAGLRRSFLDEGIDLRMEDLAMDSLAEMEFCIAIELATGLTLLPSQLAELGTTDAIESYIRRSLATGAEAGP